jgi:phosphocarrier protein
MQQVKAIIHNDVGLHARPAAQFVRTAKQFTSKVTMTNNEKTVDAKSLVRVLGLAITKETEFEITAEGDDEKEAVTALLDLIESNFTLN